MTLYPWKAAYSLLILLLSSSLSATTLGLNATPNAGLIFTDLSFMPQLTQEFFTTVLPFWCLKAFVCIYILYIYIYLISSMSDGQNYVPYCTLTLDLIVFYFQLLYFYILVLYSFFLILMPIFVASSFLHVFISLFIFIHSYYILCI